MKNKTECKAIDIGINITTENCGNPEEVQKAQRVLNQALNGLDKVCKRPCKFLDIRTGARNFEPKPNDTRFYAYYITKVAVR